MRGGNRFFRPENVLRRGEDLIAVGQKEDALQTLYDFLTSRRIRGLEPAELEPIGILFVDLGTELRNMKLVKDGLHQYKKAVQNSEGGLPSLQEVCRHYLEQSEKRLQEAEALAGAAAEKAVENAEAAAAAAQKVYDAYDNDEDEEQGEDEDGDQFNISPEDLLLSAVSTDDTKDRSNRQLVAPWLRFLWESLRTVLDILRNNSKLEVGYCVVSKQAFEFCVKYERKLEFRRLCEMLRMHLQTVSQKPNDKFVVANPVDLSSPDTLQRYLESRFAQLNAAVKLELWQEAFRSVEDVHTLMTASKRQPKPSMLMSYYDDLAQIFAVSGDLLFHAAARQKFFNLLMQSPIATADQKKRYASLQLISALSAPAQTGTPAGDAGSRDSDFAARKARRLASLLGMSTPPTRALLVEQASRPQTLKFADPVLRQLNQQLGEDFHPLSFKKEAAALFAAVEANKEYAQYIAPLLDVSINRIFREVSQVYQTVKIDFLFQLCTFAGKFALPALSIEQKLLEAASDDVVSFQTDQDAGVVTFSSDPFGESLENDATSTTLAEKAGVQSLQLSPAEFARFQLSNLARTLSQSVKLIDFAQTQTVEEELKEQILAKANDEFEAEHERVLARFDSMEGRKKELGEIKRKEAEQAAKDRLAARVAANKAEKERAENEAIRRRDEKIKREMEAANEREKKRIIKEVNSKGIIQIDEKEAKDLDVDKLQTMQVEKLEKDQRETESKMEIVARRNDFLERAERKFQLSLLEKDAQQQQVKEREDYEAVKEKRISQARAEHEHAVKERDRLKRLVPEYEKYSALAGGEQQQMMAKLRAEAAKKLEAAKQQRIQEYIAHKKAEWVHHQEQLKQEALERQRQAEEQRKAEEQKLRAAAAEEARRKRAEEARLNADPERRLYVELSEKLKAGRLTFSDKMKLKKLKQKYEN